MVTYRRADQSYQRTEVLGARASRRFDNAQISSICIRGRWQYRRIKRSSGIIEVVAAQPSVSQALAVSRIFSFPSTRPAFLYIYRAVIGDIIMRISRAPQ